MCVPEGSLGLISNRGELASLKTAPTRDELIRSSSREEVRTVFEWRG